MRPVNLLAAVAAALPFTSSAFAADHLLSYPIEEDLSDLLASAALASTVPTSCEPTFGNCYLCYRASGDAISGSFGAFSTRDATGSTVASCGGEVATRNRTVTYTVLGSQLSGTWTGSLFGRNSDVHIEATRDARLTVTSTQRGTRHRNSDSSLVADVVLLGQTISSYQARGVYYGFGGHEWTLEVSGTGTSLAGTLTRDDGLVCSVSGTALDTDVRDIDVLCS
jgi:hypothetical protein